MAAQTAPPASSATSAEAAARAGGLGVAGARASRCWSSQLCRWPSCGGFAPVTRPGDTDFVRNTSALLGALGAGIVLALGASIPLAHGDARPQTIPVGEITEGM